jgi:hypothetical protein
MNAPIGTKSLESVFQLLCSFQGADWIDSPADFLAFVEQD